MCTTTCMGCITLYKTIDRFLIATDAKIFFCKYLNVQHANTVVPFTH